jgi:hypothetical protein
MVALSCLAKTYPTIQQEVQKLSSTDLSIIAILPEKMLQVKHFFGEKANRTALG